tara:strand:- start:3887 stop:4339 length:453 start_codon:yes stop_codon:yes gene_type:complete
MKLSENTVINITFSFLGLLMIYFNYMGSLKTKLDIYISYVGIIIAVIILFVKNTIMLDIAHFLYCVVFLYSITFVSTNKYLLGLNIVMLISIVFSRYYYGVCILNKKQNGVGFFHDLSDIIAKYIPIWNWDYIFNLLLLVSAVRFIRLIR